MISPPVRGSGWKPDFAQHRMLWVRPYGSKVTLADSRAQRGKVRLDGVGERDDRIGVLPVTH